MQEGLEKSIQEIVDRMADVNNSSESNFMHLFRISGLPNSVFRGRTIEGFDFSGSDLRELNLEGTKFIRCYKDDETVFPDGVDTSSISKKGAMSLVEATLSRDIDLIESLINTGADVDLPNHYGITALLLASKEGHLEIADRLIKAGATVDLGTTNTGETPLMVASQAGHVEIVTCLVEAGATVDLRTNDAGVTSLMAAAAAGHLHVVKVLIDAGATIDVRKTDDDTTALVLAKQEGHQEIVKRLIQAGATVDQERTANEITEVQSFFIEVKAKKGTNLNETVDLILDGALSNIAQYHDISLVAGASTILAMGERPTTELIIEFRREDEGDEVAHRLVEAVQEIVKHKADISLKFS